MANIWTQFQDLLPSKNQFIGKVTIVHTDGTSTIELLDLSTIRVIGDSISVNKYALIEGSRIINEVPDLPTSSQAV